MKEYKVKKLLGWLEAQPPILIVDFLQPNGPDAEKYVENKCHWNVQAYAAKHPSTKHVYGWMKFVNGFAHHSLVEREDGSLMCVTIRPPHQNAIFFIRDDRLGLVGAGREMVIGFKGVELPDNFMVPPKIISHK